VLTDERAKREFDCHTDAASREGCAHSGVGGHATITKYFSKQRARRLDSNHNKKEYRREGLSLKSGKYLVRNAAISADQERRASRYIEGPAILRYSTRPADLIPDQRIAGGVTTPLGQLIRFRSRGESANLK